MGHQGHKPAADPHSQFSLSSGFLQKMFDRFLLGDIDTNFQFHITAIGPFDRLILGPVPFFIKWVLILPLMRFKRLVRIGKQPMSSAEHAWLVIGRVNQLMALFADRIKTEKPMQIIIGKQNLMTVKIDHIDNAFNRTDDSG